MLKVSLPEKGCKTRPPCGQHVDFALELLPFNPNTIPYEGKACQAHRQYYRHHETVRLNRNILTLHAAGSVSASQLLNLFHTHLIEVSFYAVL